MINLIIHIKVLIFFFFLKHLHFGGENGGLGQFSMWCHSLNCSYNLWQRRPQGSVVAAVNLLKGCRLFICGVQILFLFQRYMKSSLLCWGSPDIADLALRVACSPELTLSPLFREHPGWKTPRGTDRCGDTSTNTSVLTLAQQRPCQGAEGRRWVGVWARWAGPRWQDTVPPHPRCRAEPRVAAQVPSVGGQAGQGDEPSPWLVQACKEQFGGLAHLGWEVIPGVELKFIFNVHPNAWSFCWGCQQWAPASEATSSFHILLVTEQQAWMVMSFGHCWNKQDFSQWPRSERLCISFLFLRDIQSLVTANLKYWHG